MSLSVSLAELDALAIERFPGEAVTLRLFLDELDRSLASPDQADQAALLLGRLEDFLEALLVRERWR
ncbi:MAG TPA: hypothetical protein VK698_12400 [Kofleriaceae bacterium]|nr:hypothetical protein [Kofleriaceae bacterium]